GLSYTTFEYSDLKLSAETVGDDDILTVTFKVKNTGKVAGAEAAQVYVRPAKCDAARPVHELKGFDKVFLAPGEEKEVSVNLCSRAFSYFEERLNDWFSPSGEYTIEAGSSSRDIRLEAAVEVKTKKFIPMVYSDNSTLRDLTKTPKGLEVLEEAKKMNIAQFDNPLLMDILYWDLPFRSYSALGKLVDGWLEDALKKLNS
ncbi:MAG: fibronectin type III-like domain-contianing protein, partial [Parasporobacterium sp.]|nr:fibronectin type III-like domain-contianing protein [Parasporobacterium sp.]